VSSHDRTDTDAVPDRCPVCGEGAFVDIAYDVDPTSREPSQQADSRELVTYGCGHSVAGPSLGGADHHELDVERRTTDETVLPLSD
jgi:hypothetical protein